MKKSLIFVALLLLTLMTLSACDNASDTDGDAVTTEAEETAILDVNAVVIGGESAVPCIVSTRYPTDDLVVADLIATDAVYGADPTGVKDSTAAINKALEDCRYELGGGTVWLPAGTYKISEPLSVPPLVTLRGDYANPDEVTDGDYGTVLVVDYTDDSKECAVLLRQNAGIKGITFYYPNQNAASPVDLGWAVLYRGDEGSQGPAMEDITFINAYDGIGLSPDDYRWNSNSNMYLDGIRGTVLNRGLVVNSNSGACSYQNMNISPSYWAAATDAYHAPAYDQLAAYMLEQVEAYVMSGLEMPMISHLSADHCRYGVHVTGDGNRDFWGAGISFLNITDTKVAFKVDDFWAGRMAGIVRSVLMGSEGSFEVTCENATWFLTDCNLSHPPKGSGILCRYPQTTPEEYVESDTTLKPARAVLYDVTKAPYNAPCEKINTENKLGEDCTAAIQQALDDAGKEGGGIVYLPAGHYVIKGNLTIPAGVELRGAGSIPMTPGPEGGTLLMLYAGKDSSDPTGDKAAITAAGKGVGIRQIQVYYPENLFTAPDTIIAYPYAIRYDNAPESYGVNIYFSNPYLGLNVDDGSDGNYLRAISGTAGNGFIRVGKADGCCIETIHDINPGYWTNHYRYGGTYIRLADVMPFFTPYQKEHCNTITSEGATNLRVLNVLQYGGRCALEVTGGSVEAWSVLLDQGGMYCIKVNEGEVISMNSELTGRSSKVNEGELTAYNPLYIK